MRELAFAGLTEHGDLLLTTGDGQQYALAVDERLVAAVRGDRPRLGQLSIALEGATPRDIQARIRHGQSPEEIAEQTGIPLERIERYAGPPLAERAHIATHAGAIAVRRDDTPTGLAAAVLAEIGAAGADPETLAWDAWRREDGRWTVVARWSRPAGDGTDRGETDRDGRDGEVDLTAGEAYWTYDHVDRTLAPDDDLAHRLQHGAPPPPEAEPGPLMRLVVADDEPDDLDGPLAPWGEPTGAEVARARRSAAASDLRADRDTQVVDRYSGEVVDLVDGPPEQPDTPLDDLLHTDPGVPPAHAKPSRRERRKTRPAKREGAPGGDAAARTRPRAVVPSWDEILFGARRPDPPADD